MQEEQIKYVCANEFVLFYNIFLELNVMNRVGRAIQIISMLVYKKYLTFCFNI